MDTLRFRSFYNCLDLLWGSLNLSWADLKTKIINLVFQKLTFMKSLVQLCFLELVQCPPKVLPMLLQIATEDQYIIEVYQDEFVQIASEDLIHQPLERGWCIRQPKRHEEKLQVALVCLKSYFLN